MPLPPPPDYTPKRQQRIDKRRIALAGVLFAVMSAVLVGLAQRVARTPGEPLPAWPLPYMVLVIAGSFCMLNLTVATVGQTFTKVKKEAEAKRAVQGHALMRSVVQACEGARVRGKRGQ
jgi:hypothetical protein